MAEIELLAQPDHTADQGAVDELRALAIRAARAPDELARIDPLPPDQPQP